MKKEGKFKKLVLFCIAFVRRCTAVDISVHLFNIYFIRTDNLYEITVLCFKDINGTSCSLFHLGWSENYGFSWDLFFSLLVRRYFA